MSRFPGRIGSSLSLYVDRAHIQIVLTSILAAFSFCMVVLLVQRFDAPLVLATVIALTAVVPLLIWPEIATVVTVFLLYINFPAILTKQYGMPEAVAGSFILLLAIPILHYGVIRRESVRFDTPFFLMLVFLVVLLISSLGAVDHKIATARVKQHLIEGLVIYWLIINVVRNRQTLRRVICTVLIAGSLLGGLGLYQELTGSYSREFSGLAYRNYQPIEDLEGASDVRKSAKRSKWDRAQGPVNEPNRFAQIMIVLLPFAVFIYQTGQSRRARLYTGLAGFLILSGVVLTLSRGAFVTLLLIASTAVFLKWIRPSRLLICVVGLMLSAPLASPFFVSRVESITNASSLMADDPVRHQAADGAMRGRATSMLAALNVFLDHPIIGVGPGQYSPFYSMQYRSQSDMTSRSVAETRRAHVLYLEMAAETGAVGLAVFLSIVVVLLRGLWRSRRQWTDRNPELASLATACWLSILAYLGTAVFLHLSYQRYYWFLIAIAAAALHVMNSEWQAAVGRDRAKNTGPTQLSVAA